MLGSMSWIDELPEDHARARLERSLKGAVDPELGRPANVIKAHGLLPPVLDAHMALYRRVVKAAEVLPQSLREGVAVAVSARNDCFYCSIHHRVSMVRALEREGSDIDGRRLGNALIGHGRRREPLPGDTPDRLVAMVEYAMHLTETPGAMTPEHLAPVRAAGLRDVEIAELNQVVAYFNYVNRIVMGLGVQLEPEYQQSWTDGVIW